MKKEVRQTNKLINKFEDFRQYSDIFIETGTCYGRSVQNALDSGYQEIRSVEAKEEFVAHCLNLFVKEDKVRLWAGKSIDHLAEMIEDIKKPAVFWLDAHVSGEASAGHADYLEKGEGSDYHQHTALKGELAIVLAHRNDHVILIDDQNGSTPDNDVYIDMISKAGDYIFLWYDEQMGEMFYKDKILVAIPFHLMPQSNGG